MNKILMISDIHFGIKNFAKSDFRKQMQFFTRQLFPYIKENGIKNVVHCGDLFHNRQFMDMFIYQEIQEKFLDWFEENEVHFHSIVGNHDIYYKNTLRYNFLTQIIHNEPYKFIHAYADPTVVKIEKYKFGMIPWIVNSAKSKFDQDADILIVHADINGFNIAQNFVCTHGVDPTDFNKFKLVFSGHFHLKAEKNNIVFIGTPYQLNWGDFNTQKGFYVLSDNFKYDFVENNLSSKYVKVTYEEIDGKVSMIAEGLEIGKKLSVNKDNIIEVFEKNNVRLVIKSIKNRVRLDALVQNIISRDFENDFEVIDQTTSVSMSDSLNDLENEIADEMTIPEMANLYIDNIDFSGNIDKELLKSIFTKLYNSSIDGDQ